GLAKLVDFGIARFRERLMEETQTGIVRGKVAYMAPEQLRGEVVDRRSDVFALGIVLWEVTVGHRLFKRSTEADTIVAALHAPIDAPSAFDAAFPPELQTIVMRALARPPDERFQSADALAREIDRWIMRAGEQAGQAELGDWMRAAFADRMAERDVML